MIKIILILAVVYIHLTRSLPKDTVVTEMPVHMLVWKSENLLSDILKPTNKTAYRDDMLEILIHQLFTKFMGMVGTPGTIPDNLIKDPTRVYGEITFDKTIGPATIKMRAWDIQIYGLSKLRMRFVRVVRINSLNDLKLLIKICSDIHLQGQYNLKGKALGFIPLDGIGPFKISLKDFCVAAVTILEVPSNQIRKTLVINELDSAVKSASVHFDFHNLMGGGGIGNIMNTIINSMGNTIVHSQKAKLVDIIAETFHGIISQFL